MKRWLWLLIGAILALTAAPASGSDVSELKPVEFLYIYKEAGSIIVQTDTGDMGKGTDLDGAFLDLKQTTAGTTFLETVDCLILTGETESLLPQLLEYLRPACEICLGEKGLDLKGAAEYLRSHKPGVTLNDYRAGKQGFATLKTSEERFYLAK